MARLQGGERVPRPGRGGSSSCAGARISPEGPDPAKESVYATGLTDLANSDSQWTSTRYISTTCAVAVSGKVVCWGSAASGALGNGSAAFAQASLPLATAGIDNAASIVARDRSLCALRSDMTVAAGAQRAFAQTGRGASSAFYALNPFLSRHDLSQRRPLLRRILTAPGTQASACSAGTATIASRAAPTETQRTGTPANCSTRRT